MVAVVRKQETQWLLATLQSDASRTSCDCLYVYIGVFAWQDHLSQTRPPAPVCQCTTMSQPEPPTDARSANRARFELELEFVQSLANPFYLHSLAQQGILSQPAFVNFLKYLLYWKEKDYARFIL